MQASEGEAVASGFNLGEYIAFELYRGDEYSAPASELGFEVTIDDIANDRLYFKMRFENPSSVSLGMQSDVMVATILDETFFCSTDSPMSIARGTQILTYLPRLLPGDSEAFLDAASDSIENAAQTMMTG